MGAGRSVRRASVVAVLLAVGLATAFATTFATTATAADTADVAEEAEEAEEARPRRGAGKPRYEQGLAVLTERVGLREEQQQAVRSILEERSEKIRELRQRVRAGGDRTATRDEIRALIKSSSAQIEATLDEDQIPKYRKLREERSSQAQQRRPRGRGRGPR